jgi:DNA polymerase V
MTGGGIDYDDILVVDRSLTPQHNNIAVSLVDGRTTVKKFYCQINYLKLVTENSAYKKIVLSNQDKIKIQGVVVHIMKDTGAIK